LRFIDRSLEVMMPGKLKEKEFPVKIEIYDVRWYPSGRSCVRRGRRKVQPAQMPPLMVRKAEWRR
jgi:hypothetical protein